MSHWNHRVVRRKMAGLPDYYGIHEAFYSRESLSRITQEPINIGVSDDDPDQDPIKSLRETLQQMLNCLDKPILDYDTREEI